MASSLHTPLTLVIPLIIFALVLFLPTPQVQSRPLLNQVPPNLADLLYMAGQYSILNNLLCSTEIVCNIQKQLNSSKGITLFAPTDNAFSNSLPSNIYSTLSSDQLVRLLMHHFIPQYLTAAMINSFKEPVPTFVTDYIGKSYYINFQGDQELNVFNGNVATRLSVLYQEFPLVIYQADKVLVPWEVIETQQPAFVPVYSVPVPLAASSAALSPSEEFFVGDHLQPFMGSPAMSPSGEWSSISASAPDAPFVEEGSVPSSLCTCEMYEPIEIGFTERFADDNMDKVEEEDQQDNMENEGFKLLWNVPKLLYYIGMRLGIV